MSSINAQIDAAAALREIGRRIADEDCRCTSHPIFLVQQRRREVGFDTFWVTDITWLDEEYDEVPGPVARELEAMYEASHGEIPSGFTRTAYRDHWEAVQPFFTEQAADDYIAANRHNLTEPRVYVESAYRNPEWQAIRALALSLLTASPCDGCEEANETGMCFADECHALSPEEQT